ncbi:type IV secretion system protein [Xenophilus arseniciresistens]|uniref:Type IV secretion system protein n=1 Tax=Xenophilus arseniciresistens TaxID=1283306 RepID=A0AAE3N9F4_9BURK|nr:type IV secretion system protein [Xenophilus arseniciresistens]MDA7418425.1 type IV secretion system protein [Xenophilus arseniciresistens]
MNAAYFALIKQYLTRQINDFGDNLLGSTMTFATSIALVVLTIIILTKGFRIFTGRSHESAMGMVLDMSRIAVIVAGATTMAVGNIPLKQMLLTDLPRGVHHLVTGNNDSPDEAIDKVLAYTAVVMSAMDNVQGLNNGVSGENVASVGRAWVIGALGVAGPPITAGAMLLMYTFAINLFVGLGPIFILCLVHESTKQLFHGWLKYGIATMFSLAILSFMCSVIMEMMLRVAAALWAAGAINTLLSLGDGGAGLTSQAMQQGGIGLLMTVLLVTAPPMAAQFFGATVGQFSSVSQVMGGGGAQANASGLPGQVGYQPSLGKEGRAADRSTPPLADSTTGSRRGLVPSAADEVRQAPAPSLPPPRALKVDGGA